MLKTVREEKLGKVTVRLLKSDDGYVGAVIGGTAIPHVHGGDPDQVWAKLREEVGKASHEYLGYDGARARFLKLFPSGFAGSEFCQQERSYKVVASEYLRTHLPLESARSAGTADCEAAARAYAKTNMLSTFEHARTRDVLKDKDGASFIQAAAAVASGDFRAFEDIERIFEPHGAPSWPAATYLPFLWRPDSQMFLKPEVTKDYAARVGHGFARTYDSRLNGSVYKELLALIAETVEHLKDLGPRDHIDVQSYIWIVGAYEDSYAVQPFS